MSSSAYEQKLRRMGRLVDRLGLPRASQLTMLASDPRFAAQPAGDDEEVEFLQLMSETLQDVAEDRRRFTPHS